MDDQETEDWFYEVLERDENGNVIRRHYRRLRPPNCPICKQPLTWIPKYGRWYCYKCEKYA